MKKYKETYMIGIDHGYGNMKTANCCFQAGVTVYDKEPIFKDVKNVCIDPLITLCTFQI